MPAGIAAAIAPVAATPQQPVRSVTMDAVPTHSAHAIQQQTAAPPATTGGDDIFSPRSTAAMALSAISRENSVPKNLTQDSSTATSSSKAATSTSKSVSPADHGHGILQKHPVSAPPVPDPLQSMRNNPNSQQQQPPPHPHPHPSAYGYPYVQWGVPAPQWTPQQHPKDRRSMPPMPYSMHMYPVPMTLPPHSNKKLNPHRAVPHSSLHKHIAPHPYHGKQSRPSPMLMVTPTPNKKPRLSDKDKSYNRKTKSLGVLAQTFVQKYQHSAQGTPVIIDQLANDLGVERRRIYDVINIFESIMLVVKKGKNTYAWMGLQHLPAQFGILQHQGVLDYPLTAAASGIVADPVVLPKPKATKEKSLTRLSQQVLQLFLVGMGTVSLPEASEKIHGKPAMAENPTAAARTLKTKIRRLYDIANVFLAIGFLRKLEDRSEAVPARRPCFEWAYEMNPHKLMGVYNKLTKYQKEMGTPFTAKEQKILMNLPHEQAAFQQQQQATPSMMPPPSLLKSMLEDAPATVGAGTAMVTTATTSAPTSHRTVLANIHQMGGAEMTDGPRRVSLSEPERALLL